MLCQNCNKKIASVKYTEVINGKRKELYLCEECSEKLNIKSIDFNFPIDFSGFFGDLFEDSYSGLTPMFDDLHDLKCDKCNETYSEFLEKGKLGCDNCYTAFSPRIDGVLKRLHGENKHVGRKAWENIENEKKKEAKSKPENETKNAKLVSLKNELKKLVSEEKYEEAAKVRDEIKKLEENK